MIGRLGILAIAAWSGVANAAPLDAPGCLTAAQPPAECVALLVTAAGIAFNVPDPPAVEKYAARAIALAERPPATPTLELGQAYNLLATALQDQGRPLEAVPQYERALAIYDRVPGTAGDARIALHNLGWLLATRNDYAAAEGMFTRALAIARTLPDRDGEYHARVGLGTVRYRQVRNAEADEQSRAALGIAIELWGDKHVDTGRAYRLLARNLEAQARHPEAEGFYRKTLAIFVTQLSERHLETARMVFELAGVELAQGKDQAAIAGFGRALAIRTAMLGAGHPDSVAAAFQLGQLRWETGDHAAGVAAMRAALTAMAQVSGADDLQLAGQKKLLAMFIHFDERHAEDEILRRESLAAYERGMPPLDGKLIGAMAEFGTVLREHGKLAEALHYHRLSYTRLLERFRDSSRDPNVGNERARKKIYFLEFVRTAWAASP